MSRVDELREQILSRMVVGLPLIAELLPELIAAARQEGHKEGALRGLAEGLRRGREELTTPTQSEPAKCWTCGKDKWLGCTQPGCAGCCSYCVPCEEAGWCTGCAGGVKP